MKPYIISGAASLILVIAVAGMLLLPQDPVPRGHTALLAAMIVLLMISVTVFIISLRMHHKEPDRTGGYHGRYIVPSDGREDGGHEEKEKGKAGGKGKMP